MTKRPPDFEERPLRTAATMLPGSAGGRSDLPAPMPTVERPETLGGGGGSLSKVALGPVTLFTGLAPALDYSWTSVSGLAPLALVYRFYVASSSSINWAVRVTSAPSGGGDLMFEAVGIGTTIYRCSWPWLYDTGGASDLYIGIRNIAGFATDFTLSTLTAIKLG